MELDDETLAFAEQVFEAPRNSDAEQPADYVDNGVALLEGR